jgi:two-component system, cell cycle sensor histidine kinase and response regulator CckA
MKSVASSFMVLKPVLGQDSAIVDVRIVYAHGGCFAAPGLTPDEVQGKSVLDVLPRATPDWIELSTALAADAAALDFEVTEQTSGGRCACRAYRPWGNSSHVCVVCEPAGEYSQASEQLATLANQQRAILNTVSMALAFLKNRVIQWANPAFARTFGYEPSEFAGLETSSLYVDQADYERVARDGYARMTTGAVYSTDIQLRCRDGRRIWCRITGQSIDPANPGAGAIWVLHDVTEQRRLDENLQRERLLTNAIFDSIPGLLYLYDDEQRLVRWNRRHEEATGLSAEQIRGMRLLDWFRAEPAEQARVAAALQRLAVDGHAEVETSFPTRDGGRAQYFLTAVPVRIDNRDHFVGMGIDVTARRQAEAVAEASEERLKRLVEHSGDIILVLDANGNETSVSGPVEAILGYRPEEMLGRSALVSLHPDDLDACQTALRGALVGPAAMPHRIEYRTRHKDGHWVSLEAVGTNLLQDPVVNGVVLNIRDVTERKRAEEERRKLQEQLQQATKMEAVGRLAGGIAHDFNNLLTTIAGNIDLARLDLGPHDPIAANLDEVRAAAERAAALTGQLLAFSRRQMIEPRVVNLNELVTNLQRMLERLIGEDVRFTTTLDAEIRSVLVDPGQFEQVLVNLVVNARDAMPDGGALLVETANVDLDVDYCAQHSWAQPGPHVLLTVSDTGHGMSAEVRARLFEPFFTTKPTGRGTGLGLATTFGTVKQAGGSIDVYSEIGLGTTFKIYLPGVQEIAEPLVTERPSRTAPGGSGTVLVVEDESSVRELAIRLLKRLGYSVLQAANAEEALELVRGYTERIDLLMTDVVMPGMNGRELARRLTAIHPETRVLFASGYTENVIVHHGVVDRKLNFIGKPYSLQSLAVKVKEVLAGHGNTNGPADAGGGD